MGLITRFVTRVTRQVPLVEQELFTIPEQLRLPSVYSGLDIARCLVFCVVFCRSFFVPFGHCLFCLSTKSDYPLGIIEIFLDIAIFKKIVILDCPFGLL